MSFLGTVLGPFLHTVDDAFPDFWTIACYLLADRVFQLGGSLGVISL